jgi:hypothetical protein
VTTKNHMEKFVWGTSENHRDPLGKVLCSEKFPDPRDGVWRQTVRHQYRCSVMRVE